MKLFIRYVSWLAVLLVGLFVLLCSLASLVIGSKFLAGGFGALFVSILLCVLQRFRR